MVANSMSVDDMSQEPNKLLSCLQLSDHSILFVNVLESSRKTEDEESCED